MSEFTQGVCDDGAAILRDGAPMTPDEIVKALQQAENLTLFIADKDRWIAESYLADCKAGHVLVKDFIESQSLICMGGYEFHEWMRDAGYLTVDFIPYDKFIKRGLFTFKPVEYMTDSALGQTLRITPRGKVWLAAKYMQSIENYLEVA